MSEEGLRAFLRQIASEPALAEIVDALEQHPEAPRQISDVAGQNGHEVTPEEWQRHVAGRRPPGSDTGPVTSV